MPFNDLQLTLMELNLELFRASMLFVLVYRLLVVDAI